MLDEAMIVATIPVTDLERAKAFYSDVLGLRLLEETPFSMRYGAGRGTQFPFSSAARWNGRRPWPTSR